MASSGPIIDYASRDYDALVADMLELARERLPEWTDQSANDVGVLLVELFAYMGDIVLYSHDRIAAESYVGTATERRSVLDLLRLIGYELGAPVPASADLTLLFDAAAVGVVTIATGQTFTTTKEATGKPIPFRYRLPPRDIDRGALPFARYDKGVLSPFPGGAPDANTFRVYRTLPVSQVDAEAVGEVVASSDGSGNQRYSLARAPVIADSLVLTVDEGAGPVAWTPRDTLLYSQSTDIDYVVRRDHQDVAWIELGDGKYGKAPRRGRNNIVASYLVGGGAKGNVAARAISKAIVPIDQLKHVFNEKSAAGGRDAESATEAAVRGPQQFRSMGRAVTAADYQLHAMSFGVAKVRATAPGWNRVELVVAPAGGGVPTDTLKDDLRRYFEGKRMLTTQVEVTDPQYVQVFVEANLTVEPRFAQKDVVQRVRDVMRALWSFENVDFQDTLYISKIYEAVEAVEGVAAVVVTRFARVDSPAPLPADGTLRFGFREIPLVAGIELVKVEGGRTDA